MKPPSSCASQVGPVNGLVILCGPMVQIWPKSGTMLGNKVNVIPHL